MPKKPLSITELKENTGKFASPVRLLSKSAGKGGGCRGLPAIRTPAITTIQNQSKYLEKLTDSQVNKTKRHLLCRGTPRANGLKKGGISRKKSQESSSVR